TYEYAIEDASGNTVTCNVVRSGGNQTPPTINLLGDASVEVCQGTVYSDAGATASDVCEGDITGDIVVSNLVDTNVPGIYTVTYNVGTCGNAATEVSRSVEVQPAPVVENTVYGSGFSDIDMISGGNYNLTTC